MLLTTSCSFGEDLEKEVINKEQNSPRKIQKQNRGNTGSADADLQSDYADNRYAQLDTDGGIRLPVFESVSIEPAEQDGEKILKVLISLKNGAPEDFSLTYKWFYKDEEVFGEVDNYLVWKEEYKKGDIVKVQVVPLNLPDDSLLVKESVFTIPNLPPVITSEPPAEIKGENKLFEYKVETEDPDGDEVEITLKKAPAGMTIEPATGQIKWDFTEAAPGSEISIEIIATDTAGANYSQTITMTIPEGDGTEGTSPDGQQPPAS
ncbi:MAG: hypothetical protein GWO07_14960 [Candidatus Dadabacteria bacterium]|nr:hypothetical protein [Candidatus Dadabacteria bacterium]